MLELSTYLFWKSPKNDVADRPYIRISVRTIQYGKGIHFWEVFPSASLLQYSLTHAVGTGWDAVTVVYLIKAVSVKALL
jgi:hypothetical protein